MARRSKHHEEHEEHENEERWLVSFADMMTLLFALFMVLFSISSVNVSKLQALQDSLQEAFSGKVLSGGRSVMKTGSDDNPGRAAATPPLESIQASAVSASTTSSTSQGSGGSSSTEADAAKAEEQDLQELKRKLDAAAKAKHLSSKIKVVVTQEGLVIQILTDKVFFDSGSATLQPAAEPILEDVATLLNSEREHPIQVQGHTDAEPVNGRFASNWELSGARADAVIRTFISDGVLARRLTGVMHAATQPIASNSTAVGRAKNRRVDVVLPRLHKAP